MSSAPNEKLSSLFTYNGENALCVVLAECTADVEIIIKPAILSVHGNFSKIELSNDS